MQAIALGFWGKNDKWQVFSLITYISFLRVSGSSAWTDLAKHNIFPYRQIEKLARKWAQQVLLSAALVASWGHWIWYEMVEVYCAFNHGLYEIIQLESLQVMFNIFAKQHGHLASQLPDRMNTTDYIKNLYVPHKTTKYKFHGKVMSDMSSVECRSIPQTGIRDSLLDCPGEMGPLQAKREVWGNLVHSKSLQPQATSNSPHTTGTTNQPTAYEGAQQITPATNYHQQPTYHWYQPADCLWRCTASHSSHKPPATAHIPLVPTNRLPMKVHSNWASHSSCKLPATAHIPLVPTNRLPMKVHSNWASHSSCKLPATAHIPLVTPTNWLPTKVHSNWASHSSHKLPTTAHIPLVPTSRLPMKVLQCSQDSRYWSICGKTWCNG